MFGAYKLITQPLSRLTACNNVEQTASSSSVVWRPRTERASRRRRSDTTDRFRRGFGQVVCGPEAISQRPFHQTAPSTRGSSSAVETTSHQRRDICSRGSDRPARQSIRGFRPPGRKTMSDCQLGRWKRHEILEDRCAYMCVVCIDIIDGQPFIS